MVVEGKAGMREVIVHGSGPFPDYVFEKGYKRLSLHNLENFIAAYKHLPGMPSAKDIETAGGIALGEIQIKHIEKTEELYLYVFELSKENEKLKAEIRALKVEVSEK